MVFPISYLLIFLAIFAAIYIIFVLMNIFHLIAFAEVHFTSFLATFIFLGGVAYICFWAWILLAGINWQETVTFFKDVNFNGNNFNF